MLLIHLSVGNRYYLCLDFIQGLILTSADVFSKNNIIAASDAFSNVTDETYLGRPWAGMIVFPARHYHMLILCLQIMHGTCLSLFSESSRLTSYRVVFLNSEITLEVTIIYGRRWEAT